MQKNLLLSLPPACYQVYYAGKDHKKETGVCGQGAMVEQGKRSAKLRHGLLRCTKLRPHSRMYVWKRVAQTKTEKIGARELLHIAECRPPKHVMSESDLRTRLREGERERGRERERERERESHEGRGQVDVVM